MGCSGCTSGGCGSELPRGCKNNGSCGSGGAGQPSPKRRKLNVLSSGEMHDAQARIERLTEEDVFGPE